MQELIYNLNVPSRWGTQTPFTNLTFDWTCPEDLREQVPVIGGEEMPFTYGDLQAEMDMINRAYIEVMTAGDARGRVFTFPIPTYNITPDFPWESENADRLFAMTAKYGLPYFQNFLNSELKPNMVRSMCCRLQLDLRELLKRGNGLFGSAEQTGSIGVVTINCARLGYLHRGDEAALLAQLDACRHRPRQPGDQAQGDAAADGPGPLPVHQALPRHAAQPLLDHRRERHQRDDPQLQPTARTTSPPLGPRLGAAPARPRARPHASTSRRRPATCTTWRPPRPRARPTASPRKTASAGPTSCRPAHRSSPTTPIPRSCRWASPTIRSRRSRQDDLQAKYTGGTVLHLYMRERISSARGLQELVQRALTRFRLPYITITPTFSICPKHGYLSGEHEFCPKCDPSNQGDTMNAPIDFNQIDIELKDDERQPCEVWTRVMGYHRPVASFNTGKKGEYAERRFYREAACGLNG
jgi:anaerobic ribonucleoside-triphosphate reductase